ncbi:tyrosine-type recombinase/integrase [Hyphomicrobium sp.]|uniref:tyrosine-type recombinase/integrase n=1 Tax=Hyphomicrobium sp. TaxID=82 RepID=UPI002FE122A2
MAPRHQCARPHKRYGYWYLVRRVPRRFSAYDARNPVMLSTGIRIADDPRALVAEAAVQKLDRGLERYWLDLSAGRDGDAVSRYERALETARHVGVPYMTADMIAAAPVEQIVRRIELIEARDAADKPTDVTAILGGQDVPPLLLSQMMDEFQKISEAHLVGKSEQQKKRWRTPKETALNTFIAVIGGDRPMRDVARTDVIAFRQHLLDRIIGEEIEIDTANKIIGHVSGMFVTINDVNQYGLPAVFAKARISGGKDKQRVAFDPKFVQTRILAEGLFDELNDEARGLIYLVIETGLRPSEACNLDRATIRLDHEIPHVQVRPDGRQIKTDDSWRDIPLVGMALKVVQKHPNGFPRYRDKADSLSALVNKAFEARDLRPEPGQSFYSLRHTFEDRLTAVETPEKVVAALMGHKWHRPRYGKGPSLELKRKWLKRIAFRSPKRI